MYLSQLKSALTKGPLKPVYLIYGNNPFEFHEALDLLRARAAQEGDPGLSVMELSRDERDLATVMDALQTAPMFVSLRMVILQNAEQFIGLHRKSLESYLQHPSPSGVLVMTVEKWKRTTKLAKAIEKIGGDVACWVPRTSGEVMTWIVNRARSAHGKRIDGRAAELLMGLCQEDLAAADSELAKLSLYVGKAAEITEADVMAGAMSYGARNPFDLADRLMDGDYLGALKVADGLIDEGLPAVAMVGILRSSFRRLLQAVLLAERDGRPAALQSISYPKEREALAGRLGRYSGRRLLRGYRALLEADLRSKSTGKDDRLIMERLILELLPQDAAGAGR